MASDIGRILGGGLSLAAGIDQRRVHKQRGTCPQEISPVESGAGCIRGTNLKPGPGRLRYGAWVADAQPSLDAPAQGDSARSGTWRRVERGLSPSTAMTFRALCEQVLPPQTRYLVLDLDRTVHRGINLGEMLGWELGAWHAYGEQGLDRMEPRRGAGRVTLDYSRPAASVVYTVQGVRNWALPGLIYLFGGKLPAGTPWLGRQLERVVGPEWLLWAQRPTQQRLMRLLGREDPDLVERLSVRVWERHRVRQVIDREDLQWVRSRCPGIEVILASASPQVVVAFAARQLGIETHLASTPERINSGTEKIAHLRQVRPDIFAADTLTVGMTDTRHGEDHCWVDHFDVLVDINSDSPFPSLVSPQAPLQCVHSVSLMTAAEIAAR